MDNHKNNKTFGEGICLISSNQIVKSLTHVAISSEYEQDHNIVNNLYNGCESAATIPMRTIEGAKERYKHYNKSILEVSPFSEDEKRNLSRQIDIDAEIEKQKWISNFRSKGMIISE